MRLFGTICTGLITACLVLWTGIALGWFAYGTRVQIGELQKLQARQAQLNSELVATINKHHGRPVQAEEASEQER